MKPEDSDGASQAERDSGPDHGVLFPLLWTVFFLGWFCFTCKNLITDRYLGSWVESPCEILSLEIRDDQQEKLAFALEPHFRYEWKGKQLESHRFWPKKERGEEYDELYLARKRVLDRKSPFCYVNSKTEEAVLELESGFTWGVGRNLVCSFLGVIIGFWMFKRSGSKAKGNCSEREDRGKNESKRPEFTRFGLKVFNWSIGVTMLLATAFACFLLGLPSKIFSVADWKSAEATIHWSRIVSSRRHQPRSLNIHSFSSFYSYEIEGKKYYASRYQIFTTSGMSVIRQSSLLEEYAEGVKTTCYYDPEEPWRAVLKKEQDWHNLSLLILPLFLCVSGFLAFVIVGRRVRREWEKELPALRQ